jgi:hypothetical protein
MSQSPQNISIVESLDEYENIGETLNTNAFETIGIQEK